MAQHPVPNAPVGVPSLGGELTAAEQRALRIRRWPAVVAMVVLVVIVVVPSVIAWRNHHAKFEVCTISAGRCQQQCLLHSCPAPKPMTTKYERIVPRDQHITTVLDRCYNKCLSRSPCSLDRFVDKTKQWPDVCDAAATIPTTLK
jgi:hypothetical protein